MKKRMLHKNIIIKKKKSVKYIIWIIAYDTVTEF